ncbi:interferon regulatory factor 2-binding protein 2-B isoform X1 [Eurytemora carolleeae]|uniref:interferon regulatory factor 2-binding protein 2-B isoform X1 n=1 Tax=Eurytemora carolleeae TaxID=1294199 RepID=UPI000C785510|nr:interferon regulatory factor 2-binding protein 2-B isoform X1 [Eurytemora carolleeae]XP_023320094.1 interferon regulatory factor 2-binding protein 2-B isoform X1 [Eurytemora carolleeae]XP_023320095.1 interferon regulatory factor 2-binding protein 2-B isoform X1 [Eurytemora carolleeae]XP_023320097.1 interferon regulatory factor 2-binding protein 2-B isoform X1 [Eurytemora carolleeae]|eukprot:XP_023320093.1 interferon regulatory factor 2-binding protein 2-B-like isoform X1 [Eurytemora affinis]
MSNPLYRKQTCYLCEMPRSPWAVLHDFTEIVCRSCVNYEGPGPDRIEAILASARRMRGSYGMQEVQQIKRESAPYPGAQRPLSFQQPVEVGGGGIPMYTSPLGAPQLHGLEQGFQRRQPSNPHAQTFGPGGPLTTNGMGPGYTDKMKGPENKNKVGGPPLSRPLSNGPPSTQSRPDQVSSSSNGQVREGEVGADGNPILKCTNCAGKLEDTHFVQCPSNQTHKFCFSCCRDSIIKQGNEAFCPSGDKCPLAGSTVPWAFMQEEIQTILGMNNLKEKS